MALIVYNKTTQLGGMVSSLVNGVIQMQFLANRIRNILVTSGTTQDKLTQIETLFGLEKGQGLEFVNNVMAISNKLDSIKEVSKLDLG